MKTKELSKKIILNAIQTPDGTVLINGKNTSFFSFYFSL